MSLLNFYQPKLFFLFLLIVFGLNPKVCAQIENTGMTDRMDSMELGKVNLSGYADVYYGFDFNQPFGSNRLYAVSSPRHNEFNINLAYIDIKYANEKVRARFIPGVGTYINSNYAAETGTLKNIIEANVGVRLFSKKDIWVDAGVIGSPFTNETAISKDHLMYTRSFAAEYSPYYLSGVRLSYPLKNNLTFYGYLINGWQQISDVNKPLSVATQLEFKGNSKLLLNWNNYFGSEESDSTPLYGNRFFTDFYAIYYPTKKLSFTSNVYYGLQNKLDTLTGNRENYAWWQANIIGRYQFNKNISLSARIEHFNDHFGIVSKAVTQNSGLKASSAGLCFNYKIDTHALFRIEGRHFFSTENVFESKNRVPINTDDLLITSLTVWF